MSSRNGRPRSRVLRLRRWLLATAVLFALLLVSLIGYTHYRALRAKLDLPKQLGFDVKSQAGTFTISRSGKDGRPLFTIHGSKAVQHQNGITTIHDVSVTLYGPAGSNRTDSIRGGEFDYDQKNGIVRAMGETVLDVGIVEGSQTAASAKRLIMRGKGLVFLQNLGVASTREQIQFQYGSSQGEAVGADYDMDTGVVTLQHDVHLHSEEQGQTQRIDAASAQLNRNTRVATLQDATVTQDGDYMRAPHMVATLRTPPDENAGTLQKVDATGGVTLRTAAGEQAQAPELHADVTTENRLGLVTMTGGVHLEDEQSQASAQRVVLRFRNGAADHVTLAGSAHVLERGTDGESRTLDAATIDSTLVSAGGTRLSAGEMRANGGSKLVVVQPGKRPGVTERTELTSATLVAHATPGTRKSQLRDIQAGQGAHLVQDDGSGGVSTSSSDSLFATFAPAAAGSQTELDSVVQRGHVVLHESRPAAAAGKSSSAHGSSTTDASAEVAEFHAATDLLVLTGSPRVSGDGVQVSAERVAIHRGSGDAEADGKVRGSVVQPSAGSTAHSASSAEPAQFVGETVRMTHSTGDIVLQGGASEARLWTSNGQVEAPTIEANQKANSLHAFGAGGANGAASVKTVLLQSSANAPASRPSAQPAPGDEKTPGSTRTPRGPARVFSRELLYRGGTAGKPGVADFRGGVRMIEGEDVITADTATALLQPAKSGVTGSAASGMLGSSLQSITAEGHVRVQQGPRVATGARLLYTASTRDAVLTGTPGAPPVLRDPLQGNLTGTQILLHLGQVKGDNQVEVKGAPSTPVHTELDVPEKANHQPAQPRLPSGRKPSPIP